MFWLSKVDRSLLVLLAGVWLGVVFFSCNVVGFGVSAMVQCLGLVVMFFAVFRLPKVDKVLACAPGWCVAGVCVFSNVLGFEFSAMVQCLGLVVVCFTGSWVCGVD